MLNISKRLHSLDVFRGLCIAGMILVDHPGSWDFTYPAVTHSAWNGWTPADLIFPFFLFIMGVSLTFSVSSSIDKGAEESEIKKKIIKRSILLFALGVFLNGFPFFSWNGEFSLMDFSTYRIMGVLQRIGIVYLICSFLYMNFTFRKLAYIGSGILLLYWMLMTLVPVPGFGAPDLANYPGDSLSNITLWLDKVILGAHKPIWAPFDPEGILSTLPSVVNGIIGVMVGIKLRSDKNSKSTLLWLVVFGGILLLAAYAWEMVFPINKQMWTSSFVLLTSGWALIFFASFSWLIDHNNYLKYFKPLQVIGMNAIFIFTISIAKIFLLYAVYLDWSGKSMSINDIIADSMFFSWLPNYPGSFMYAIASLLMFQAMAYYLYKNKKFIKI